MKLTPALYLLPVPVSDGPLTDVLPQRNIEIISQLRVFIVENLRTARRFLKRVDSKFPIDDCRFFELNGHTNPLDIAGFLEPLRDGEPIGVMSEAGCPAIADPGAQAVEVAQREGLTVVPLVGPSSIIMGLMASGFNGQCFCFKGYLPIDAAQKTKMLRELEAESAKRNQTQIFIETPYRNNKTIKLMAETLRPDTGICVACELTDPELESVVTLPAKAWKSRRYDYDKHPAIFLIHAGRVGRG